MCRVCFMMGAPFLLSKRRRQGLLDLIYDLGMVRAVQRRRSRHASGLERVCNPGPCENSLSTMIQDAFIIDGLRTPIGKFGGTLSTIRTDDLGAHVLRALIERQSTLPRAVYDDVIVGCANQAGEDNRNVARMCLLLAGLPWSVPGETVNRLCASGMSAVIHANRAIKAGDGDVFIAGGVEHMTRGPWVISKVSKAFGRDAQMHDSSFGWRFVNSRMEALYGTDGMGTTAENLAEKYQINREDQDRFAYHSQMKAAQRSFCRAEPGVPARVGA